MKKLKTECNVNSKLRFFTTIFFTFKIIYIFSELSSCQLYLRVLNSEKFEKFIFLWVKKNYQKNLSFEFTLHSVIREIKQFFWNFLFYSLQTQFWKCWWVGIVVGVNFGRFAVFFQPMTCDVKKIEQVFRNCF